MNPNLDGEILHCPGAKPSQPLWVIPLLRCVLSSELSMIYPIFHFNGFFFSPRNFHFEILGSDIHAAGRSHTFWQILRREI